MMLDLLSKAVRFLRVSTITTLTSIKSPGLVPIYECEYTEFVKR